MLIATDADPMAEEDPLALKLVSLGLKANSSNNSPWMGGQRGIKADYSSLVWLFWNVLSNSNRNSHKNTEIHHVNFYLIQQNIPCLSF